MNIPKLKNEISKMKESITVASEIVGNPTDGYLVELCTSLNFILEELNYFESLLDD